MRLAILDGRVEFTHPCLANAHVMPVDLGGSRLQKSVSSMTHATAIASLLFSKGSGSVQGVGPNCTGLSADIYSFDRSFVPHQCSETLLAYAINKSLEFKADIINISAGFDMQSCNASSLLRTALNRCAEQGTLVVASVSNTGSEINSIPACLPGVLAVGSLDAQGAPSKFSSFHPAIAKRGILAPGEGLLCAAPGGAFAARSGTSYAAAIVSGVASVLLSVARGYQTLLSAIQVGEMLVSTALACQDSENGGRCLAGRLNIEAALRKIVAGERYGRGFV